MSRFLHRLLSGYSIGVLESEDAPWRWGILNEVVVTGNAPTARLVITMLSVTESLSEFYRGPSWFSPGRTYGPRNRPPAYGAVDKAGSGISALIQKSL